MNKYRKSGYYWCRIRLHAQYVICYYSRPLGLWSAYGFNLMNDDAFAEIDENQITR